MVNQKYSFCSVDFCSQGSLGVEIQMIYDDILSAQDKVAEVIDIVNSLSHPRVSMTIGNETAVTVILSSSLLVQEDTNGGITKCMSSLVVYPPTIRLIP